MGFFRRHLQEDLPEIPIHIDWKKEDVTRLREKHFSIFQEVTLSFLEKIIPFKGTGVTFHIALFRKKSDLSFKIVASNIRCSKEKKLKEKLVPHSKSLMKNYKSSNLKISFVVMKDSKSVVSGLTVDCKLENTQEYPLELPY